MALTSTKAFWALSVGDSISRMGSGLTTVALAVWVLQRTQTLTQFSVMILIASLPGILLMPVAGIMIDRFDRRRTLLACYTTAGLSVLSISVVFLTTRNLPFWYLMIVVALISTSIAVGTLAFTVSVPLLVSENFLGRANGIMQLGQAASGILAPIAAGFLLTVIGIQGLVLIDVVTYGVVITFLSFTRIPSPGAAVRNQAAESKSKEALAGWTYLRKQPGMIRWLLYLAAISFFLNMSGVLVQSLTLKLGSPAALGLIISAFGMGMISGAALVSIWGSSHRHLTAIIGFGLLQGFGLIVAGSKPSLWVVAFGLAIAAACWQVISTSIRVLWQTCIPAPLQGRSFAALMLVLQVTAPLAYLVVGPLADNIFEPLLSSGGLLSDNVGHLIGVGSGRGLALMLIILGLLTTLTSVVMSLNLRMRRFEEGATIAPAPDCAPLQGVINSQDSYFDTVERNHHWRR